MKLSVTELSEILKKHELWIKVDPEGKRADLSGANLRGANLSGANLRGADLSGANLSGANLFEANLSGASLSGANLSGASLSGANLYRASLFKANLRGVNLSGANLYRASLSRADLSGANLSGANLFEANLFEASNIPFIPMACPEEGSFIGWKKCSDNCIVKLLIPEDAKRSSATGRKCRANKAVVLRIETLDGSEADISSVESNYDHDFVYEVGKTVIESNFCEDRFRECAPGIHFFINRQEAVEYVF